jgi:phenylalanyl-tRNA synthetase beta chain
MLSLGGLETTVVAEDLLEVDILPNRADAWSIRGMAREVSALTKFKLKERKLNLKEGHKKVSSGVKVEVRDKMSCPRYMARVIENVKILDSPEWLKKRLERVGIRSINNVVDVTNYILHELGQPLHAFDASLITEQKIIVRRANPGEKVVTLDGKEHELKDDMLVIADAEKTIAVAGIMGCVNTEVRPTTKTIILESAFFDPILIHKTSKLLKIRSESSIRFEHGVDWVTVEEALDRAAALIAELGRGVEVLRGKIDVVGKEPKLRLIELRTERVGQILGTEIPVGDMLSILNRLGFLVKKEGKSFKVQVPTYRLMDIEREIDLIEELARIWGYGRVEPTMPRTAYADKEVDLPDKLRQKVQEILVGAGLTEVQSYSMIGPKDFEKSKLLLDHAVKITNPLTVEGSIMRTKILPGLLNIAVHNQNRQVESLIVFEIGIVFDGKGERWSLGGLLTGSPFMSAIDKGEVDYYYLKGVLENLFRDLGIQIPKVSEAKHPWVQPGKGAEIEDLGLFGALHPDIQHNYELTKPLFFFEFDLDSLFKLVPKARSYRPIPKFPSVTRDISMFIPTGLENQLIIEQIIKSGGELVEEVFPFDKYKDSVAYRLIYRHPERTLTEDEVNKKHQEIVQMLTTKLMVRIR